MIAQLKNSWLITTIFYSGVIFAAAEQGQLPPFTISDISFNVTLKDTENLEFFIIEQVEKKSSVLTTIEYQLYNSHDFRNPFNLGKSKILRDYSMNDIQQIALLDLKNKSEDLYNELIPIIDRCRTKYYANHKTGQILSLFLDSSTLHSNVDLIQDPDKKLCVQLYNLFTKINNNRLLFTQIQPAPLSVQPAPLSLRQPWYYNLFSYNKWLTWLQRQKNKLVKNRNYILGILGVGTVVGAHLYSQHQKGNLWQPTPPPAK